VSTTLLSLRTVVFRDYLGIMSIKKNVRAVKCTKTASSLLILVTRYREVRKYVIVPLSVSACNSRATFFHRITDRTFQTKGAGINGAGINGAGINRFIST